MGARPVLVVVAWQLRAGLFPGRIVVTPSGVRYRFAHARLDKVD